MGLKVGEEGDHAKAGSSKGLKLRPTYVLLFGNPEVGTVLMQADPRVGLDLPLRLLIWENKEGKVFVSYHDPIELQEAYQLEGQKETVEKMQEALKKLTTKESRKK